MHASHHVPCSFLPTSPLVKSVDRVRHIPNILVFRVSLGSQQPSRQLPQNLIVVLRLANLTLPGSRFTMRDQRPRVWELP